MDQQVWTLWVKEWEQIIAAAQGYLKMYNPELLAKINEGKQNQKWVFNWNEWYTLGVGGQKSLDMVNPSLSETYVHILRCLSSLLKENDNVSVVIKRDESRQLYSHVVVRIVV